MSDEIPEDLRYTKEHEWARRDGDLFVVGITAHAVEQLGDITMVSLPEPQTSLTAGETFGDIDSVKAVSDLYAPMDGTVVEVNTDLEDAPQKVNESPYGDGWLLKLRPSNPDQWDELLDAEAYRALVADS